MKDCLCLYSSADADGITTTCILILEPIFVSENMSDQPETALSAPAPTEKKRGLRSWLKFPHSWADVRKLGWKFIVGFILFYLIRDGILYILLPYLAYKGIIGN